MIGRFLALAGVAVLSVAPAAAQPKDKVFMKDGQILSGDMVNPSFKFSTPYGEVLVPNSAVFTIERKGEATEILTTVNREVISGYIANEYLEIAVGGLSGPRVQARKELITKVVFGPREPAKQSATDYFAMKNGDRFYGRVLDRSFDFTTSYGNVSTAFSTLLKLEDVDGQTRMSLADGNVMMGYLSSNYIRVETNYGFTMNIPRSSIRLVQMHGGAR